MKIAIAVNDENGTYCGNGGHAPLFAVYTRKSNKVTDPFVFETIRPNPRTDRGLDMPEDHCSHSDAQGEPTKEHFSMAKVLEDCDYLVAKRVCKNSAEALLNYGIKIKKYTGEATQAETIVEVLF